MKSTMKVTYSVFIESKRITQKFQTDNGSLEFIEGILYIYALIYVTNA